SRRRHTRSKRDWSSDVCSSDLHRQRVAERPGLDGVINARAEGFAAVEAGELHAGVVAEGIFPLRSCFPGRAVRELGQRQFEAMRSEERRGGKEGRCGWWVGGEG